MRLFLHRFWLIAIALASVYFSSAAIAQDKIAVIDIERAAVSSDYAKGEIAKLKESETFKANFAEYNRLGKEFQTAQEEAKTKSLTWSDDEKKKHRKELETKLNEINSIGKKLDAEKIAVEQRIQKELTPKIEKIVPDIIKEKNLGLLINAKAAYFTTPDFDITQELVERLNKLK